MTPFKQMVVKGPKWYLTIYVNIDNKWLNVMGCDANAVDEVAGSGTNVHFGQGGVSWCYKRCQGLLWLAVE